MHISYLKNLEIELMWSCLLRAVSLYELYFLTYDKPSVTGHDTLVFWFILFNWPVYRDYFR